MSTLHERLDTIIRQAEVLADECADAGLHSWSDRLRLTSARAAIDKEVVEAAMTAGADARRERTKVIEHLRAFNIRVELELAAAFPRDVAAAYLSTARVSPVATARFRLRHLEGQHREVLGSLASGLEGAVGGYDQADDACLQRAADLFVARARASGRGAQLRKLMERAKAALLTVLPKDSAAAVRVRRRVVRTRKNDNDAFFRSWPTLEGAPITDRRLATADCESNGNSDDDTSGPSGDD